MCKGRPDSDSPWTEKVRKYFAKFARTGWANQPERYPFSTDLTSNVFRAVYLLDGYREELTSNPNAELSEFVGRANDLEQICRPALYVATLAGFQRLGDGRSMMVAADSRLTFTKLAYVVAALLGAFLFVVGIWLYRGMEGGSAMSNFIGMVILDSRWLTARLLRGSRGAERTPAKDLSDPPLSPRWRKLPLLLTVLGGCVATVAVVRFLQVTTSGPDAFDLCRGNVMCRFNLTHGRDIIAIYCVWTLYASLALIGVMRLCIAGRRYEVYGLELHWPESGQRSRPWLIPVLIMMVIALVTYLANSAPVSVDARHPWFFALLALVCSVGFLFAMGWHMRQLSRLTLRLSMVITPVRRMNRVRDWPTPKLLQERAQTPFNLLLDEEDIASLKSSSLSNWIRTTECAINGNWPYAPGGLTFADWQRQLVAELKLLVVAIRFAAWAAMGAPLAVLLAMSVYAPVYERWLKTWSLSLLLIGFVCTVIVVLRLEKNPMLGPMFTSDGDALSFGGGLRALWPKFLAMGAVLVPLVLPDVWTWINTVVRSINSLG